MTKTTRLSAAILTTLMLIGSGTALAAMEDVLIEFVQARAERLAGVNVYVERIKPVSFVGAAMQDDSCLAAANCLVFDVVADVPMVGRVERQMSLLEVAALTGMSMNADSMEAMGGGFLLGQMGLNRAATGDVDPTGGLGAVGDYFSKDPEDRSADEVRNPGGLEPWLDPFSMIGAGGYMMMDAAEGMRDAEQTLDKREEIAAAEGRRQQSMMSQLERRGVETFAGVQATRYDSMAPPASMGEVEGQEVVSKSNSLWVDHDRNLLVGHRFEGTFTENGESRDFFVQVENHDFRNPPGCFDLLKPYKRVTEMGGMLNDEQMAEMKEAQKQLAEFDKQMAAMPASQRQMMENMMGSQMDTVRNMAESGTLSQTLEVEEILCNPDLKALFSTPMDGPGVIQPSSDGLLRQIQFDLKTLDYEPGNTDGVLDTMTQVAISQFQAESGLAVTGEPSVEVANALAIAVGR